VCLEKHEFGSYKKYSCGDMKHYGWCYNKYVNAGKPWQRAMMDCCPKTCGYCSA
jgi:hypothetical protein